MSLIHNGYKNILVLTVDTDALVLLISHIGQVELGDVDIHAYLINSEIYYGIRAIIQELESNIWLKSSQKDDLTEVFIQLGETPAR